MLGETVQAAGPDKISDILNQLLLARWIAAQAKVVLYLGDKGQHVFRCCQFRYGQCKPPFMQRAPVVPEPEELAAFRQ